jgi:ATPase subunit of ABC transporter with duplicated ATPase domains
VIGPNGTGKTHFMRLVGGEDVRTRGSGSSARASSPRCSRSCTSAPDLADLPILEVLRKRGMSMTESMAALAGTRSTT